MKRVLKIMSIVVILIMAINGVVLAGDFKTLVLGESKLETTKKLKTDFSRSFLNGTYTKIGDDIILVRTQYVDDKLSTITLSQGWTITKELPDTLNTLNTLKTYFINLYGLPQKDFGIPTVIQIKSGITIDKIDTQLTQVYQWNVNNIQINIDMHYILETSDPAYAYADNTATVVVSIINSKDYVNPKEIEKQLIVSCGPKPTLMKNNISKAVHEYLLNNLKDPDSLKYEVSNALPAASSYLKCYVQTIRIRAKNSFGGYVIAEYTFHIKNDCVIESFSSNDK